MSSAHTTHAVVARLPWNRLAAYLLAIVAMVFTMVGLLPQSVRADEAAGDEGISTYALSDYTVQGLSPNGTTINLFDYWVTGQDDPDNVTTRQDDSSNRDEHQQYLTWVGTPGNPGYRDRGINADHVLKFGAGMGTDANVNENNLNDNTVNDWTNSAAPRTGIVSDLLGPDGYPALSTALGGATLGYLFNSQSFDGKQAYMDVDGLLQVDEEGYYYYDSQRNFAEFDEGSDGFTLYDTWGVAHGGNSPDGQFFPFNTGSEVFNERGGRLVWKDGLTSTDAAINHYFGMSMSTRFVQRYGGHTDQAESREVTYNFSGDDDVWVFIDDVLVGDLGGIHDATALEINFSTGKVYVYDDENGNNVYDEGEWLYNGNDGQTLKQIFQAAGRGTSGFSGDTFADDTFHTLDFFYLERGNTDSNMSLKYNLVTIPETDIQKIDQQGDGIGGVEFSVTDQNGTEVCTAKTDAEGNVVLRDGEFPITLDQLSKEGVTSLTFTEETTPVGYRSSSPFTMRLEQHKGSTLLLANDQWTKGAYAISKVTTSINEQLKLSNGDTVDVSDFTDGTIFVIVEKNTGTAENPNWQPVYGDPVDGWYLAGSGEDMDNVIVAAWNTGAVFALASSGSYEATIDGLPGNVLDYQYFGDEGDGSLRGRYYYSTEKRWSDMDATNTHLIVNSDGFDRVFSARVYIPNTVNRFIVQKVDENGTPVNGVEMALYKSDQVDVDPETGTATVKEGQEPIQRGETRELVKDTDSIELDGGYIFTNLEDGIYWVGEYNPATGYVYNDTLAKVIVENDGEHPGVYADAGEADDGISVVRGVGRIVRSMIQFAVDDDIDLTLHNIVAAPMVGDEVGAWKETGEEPLHLKYADDGDAVLDYEPYEEGGEQYIIVDEGIPYLSVKQCQEESHIGTPREELDELEDGEPDITNLYTGVTIVRITNAHSGDFELSKTVDPESIEDKFTFELSFAQDIDGLVKDGAIDEDIAGYIAKLLPGDYKYVISGSNGRPAEEGTLIIGDVDGEQGGTEPGEGVGSATYVITNVVPESGNSVYFEGASEGQGAYTVKLAHGEKLTIESLPIGTQITATEVKPAGSYLTTVEATPEVTTTEVTASNVEANVDADGEGDSATAGTETETAADGEDTADGTDGDNTDAATIEGLALDEEESAVTDGEQTTDAGEDGGVDVSNETVAPQVLATSVYTATTIIEKQVTGEGADAPVSYNASIAFTNTQSANATINVQKTLVGTYWMADKNAYEFTITASEETPKAPLPDPAKITIDAKSDDSFDEGSETEPVEPTSATVRVGSFGEIAFTGVKAGDSFEYEIKETHPTSSGNGWTYDGHTVKVTVTFEQDETTHELKAVVTYDNTAAATDDDKSVTDAAAFTNIYELTPAETESSLTGTKTLNRDFQQDDSFTFDVSAAYAAPENSSYSIEAGQIPLPEYVTRTNDGDGNRTDAGTITVDYDDLSGEKPNVDFGAVTFELPGTYTYMISERVPDGATNTALVDAEGNPITYGEATPEQQAMEGWTLNGVTYDRTSFTVTYTVTDDGDGTMTVAGPDYGIVGAGADDPALESLKWDNTYKASGETEAELDFTKVLVGKDWATDDSKTTDVNEADSFTFTLTPLGGTTDTTFKPGEDFDPENLPESFDIAAGDVPMPMAEDEDGTSVPVTEVTVSAATETVSVDGATYDAADFSFGPIAYTAAGKYYYQVTENVPQQDADPYNGAMTYSAKTVVVEVTVTDNLKGGFTASVAYLGEAEGTVRPQFTNMYGTELDYGTEGGLNIEKSLDGRDIKSGELQFVVTAQDSATADKFGIENSGTEAVPVYTKTVTLDTDQRVDTATGIATATLANVLGNATFTQDDDGVPYELTVREVKGAQGGVMYDDVTYTLTITTADDGRGHLTVTTVVTSDKHDAEPVTYTYTNTTNAEPAPAVTLEFNNAYDASTTPEGALVIAGTKDLTNANIAGYEGKFTFTLSYVYSNENGEQVTAPVLGGDNGTTPVKTTNDDEGNFAFPAMAYTTDQLWSDVKSGIAKYDAATDTFTYTYRVSEDTSDLPEGVTGVSGATSFDVTVTVADNGNGTLKATPTYPQSGSTIKNTYGTGAEDQVVLSGTKVLSSQEGDNPPSIAGQYTFTLTAPEGTPLPQGEGGQTVTTATNDASGSVLFGTITYTMEDLNGATLIDTDGHRYKDFTYTVTESGSVTGVTNDAQSTRTVTVRVTDNGNGTLSAKIVDGNGTEVQGSSFTFTNTYTAVEVTLEATKRVVGAASVEPFTFTLTQMPEEGAPNNVYVLQNGELVAFESETATTVESIADGETDTVSFGELVFTAAGTYTFQVVENEAAGTAPDHWTYDKSVKTITVNVTADEGGKLTATTIVDGQETNNPTFINTYYNGEEAKTVHNPTTDPEVNIDGQLVGVGSVLEYRIDWVNNAVDGNGAPTSSVVIKDTIPAGTELVEGSINPGTDEDAGITAEPATDVDGRTTITWTLANRAPGDRGTVSFQVRVTEDAIEGFEGEDAPALTNQATVTAGNKYETNITSNPLPEKTSSDDTSNDGVKLGDTLTFTITYTNGEDEPATVMVSDTLSSGLTYEADSWTITDSEDNLIEGVDFKQNGQTLTWTISNVAAGESGTVSFKATVNENAVTGTDPITNKATVKVGDNPAVDTNTTTDEVEKGELSITKVVASDIADATYDTNKTFTFTVTLTKDDQPLTGPYTYSVNGGKSQPLTLDNNGTAQIKLSDDQTATIERLPVGAHYEVTEADYSGDGFTTRVTDGSSTGDIAANNAVTFTNTYGATGELSGNTALTVTKSIVNRDWQDGDSFEFTLSAGDDATEAAVDSGDVVLPSGANSNPVTVTNTAGHTAAFGSITFNQTGTYTFAITETVPDAAVNPAVEGGTVAYGDATDEQKAQPGWTLNGLTYDNQLHTVTVTVKDNGNGKLTATPAEGTADLAVEIANGYEASGSLSLAATKQLKNDEIAEYDGAFKFDVSVSKADGTSKTISSGTNDETGAIAFDAIDYTIEKLEDDVAGGYAQRGTDAGGNRTYTYVYTVAEDASGLPDGVTAGVANHTVTVVVTDDGNGNLTAAVTDPVGYDGGKGLVFENTYGASGKAEITVGGTKTYATAGTTNAPDIAGKYTFTLTGADGAPMPEGAVDGKLEVTNATGGASETISFGTITYTMDDLDGATDTDDDGKRDRTFTYTVTESGTVEGVDNDSDAATGKTFTVTLVDNGDGTITATCDKTPNAQFAFTNTYRVDPVTTEAPLEGTKAMDGRAFKAGDTFTFTIEGERESDGAAAPLPSKATPTGEGATTGTVTITPTSGIKAGIDFGTIEFTEPGTYIYTVSESDFDAAAKEAMPNVEKDPTVFTVTYVVTDDGDGTMSVGEPAYAVVGAAEGSEAPAGLAWTNTYTAEMDYDAAGGVWFEKTLTGYNFGAGKFSFTVTANDDGSQAKLAELAEGDLNLSSPALTDGVAASWQGISGLTFDQDDAGKTFTFVVTETVPEGATQNDDGTYTLAGITYDGSSVTVAIKVFDNGDGTMHTVTTVTKDGESQEFDSNDYKADDASTRPTASFANSYEAADAVVSDLSVRKAVEGAPNDEDFTFTATFNADESAERAEQVEGGVAGIEANVSAATLTATVSEDFTAEQLGEDNAKTASLGTVTFTEPGIYVFDVKETNTAAGLGWTYDKDTEPIIVTVTDDGTGQLEASTAFGTEGDTNSPLFVNSYATQPTTVDGETKLAGSKTLTGRDALAGETFAFELIPDEATKEAIDAGNLVLGATTAEVSGLEDGEPVAFHFGDITVKVAGTYDFTVQETQHNGKELPADGTNGMTYDRHIGTVQIVADETTTGQFDITVTTGTVTDGAKEDDLTFENSYTPDPVSFGIDEAFGGTKTVADESGHFEFETGQFTFILRAQNANNPLPSGDGIAQLPSEDGLPGVSVTNGAPNENGEASFDFGSIEFTEPGTYIYNIFEDTGEMPDGVSADDAQYTLTITVSENEATGELYIADGDVVAVKVVKGTGEGSQNIPVGTDEFDFTNTYDAGQTDYNQPILKNLVGRDFLAKDSFVFEVVATATDLEGNPMAFDEIPLPDGTTTGGTMSEIAENETGDGYSYTVTINPFGSASPDSYRLHTGKVTYTHEGIYTYTISEVPGSDPNITYSDAEYTVVVTVEVNDDDPDNPVLTRSVAIDGATVTAGNTIDFTNTYTTTGTLEGEFAIEAAKAITGRDWLDADSFTVTLAARGGVVDGSPIAAAQVPMPLDENGEVADTLVLTKANPSGVFRDIAYTQSGTYNYRLTEVGRGTTSAGITYSRAVYDVVVTAVDNDGDGTMTVTSTMTRVRDDAGTALNPGVAVDDRTALFTNTYDSSMDYDDEAGGVWFSKTLTGHDLAVGQFSFTVGTAEGDVASAEKLAEATTQLTNPEGAEDGVATSWSALSGLTFDEGDAGTTFTFTVSETNGGVPGYAYDAETATVEIQVVDEGDGTMYTLTTVTKGDASTTYDSRTFDADDPGTYPTVAFANSYEDVTLTGDTALGVRKAVVGHDTAVDFAFTATFNDGASTGSAAAIEGLDANGALTTTIAGDFADGDTKDADFGAVTFKEPGVYVFDVVEDNAAGTVPAGWYYDENTYKITVTVEEGDGTGLTATTEVDGVDTNNPTFTNTYSVTPTTLPGATNLRVTKELEGRDWLGDVDSYTFTLKLTSGNDSQVTMPDPSVVIIDANTPDHEAAFGDITFAAADTYTFTVTESAAVPGVTNDPQSVRTVTVDVVDNNDGTLTPSVTSVTAPNADGETVDSDLTFTNTYDPADATLEGEGAIKVQKTLTGRAWAEGEAYSFTIAPAEGYEDAPMPENATVTVGAPTEGPVNTAAFGTMTFSQAGTYVYEISENVPGEGDEGYRAMMAYDAHVATVTVAVTEDQAAGTLTAHVIYDNSAAPSVDDQYVTGAAAFTNTQNLKCELPLSGTKTLEGRNFQDGDSFTFTVSADPGTPLPNGLVLNEAGPDATEVSGSVTVNPTEGTSAAVNFGTITFTQAGEYIYHIAEQAGSASGMTYDTTERVVIVTVTDDGQGNLTSAITVGADQLAWTNTYTPVFDGATTVNLNGTKVLEGSTLAAGQFFFSVTPLDGAPMGDTWEFGNTNGLGANGALENVGDIELLRNITYTVADMGDATEKTFRYVVTEEIPSEGDRMPGLAYDGSAYLASVTVTDDLAGNLVASAPAIEKGTWDGTTFTADEDQSGVEGVVFTNGYTVSGTTAAPVQVTKVLAGNRTAPLAAGEFEFELSIVSADPADGLTLPEETTASNAADGTVSFGEVSFSKPGTYVLSVAEVVPEGAEQNGDGSYTLDGVTYDTHAVTMTYTVVDQNAQLVATLGAVEGDTTFTNTYNATETLDGAANLTVTKAVEGDFTWKEGTSFTFALTGADIATQEAIANGTVVLPDNADGIAIAYNAADPDAPHTAFFGDITFKAAGDYLFAITEQQGDIAGMTYDVEQHLVSVAVTDNGDGTLAVVPDADTVNPTITNTYEPTEAVLSGAGNLTVTKNLVGRDWQEGDSFIRARSRYGRRDDCRRDERRRHPPTRQRRRHHGRLRRERPRGRPQRVLRRHRVHARRHVPLHRHRARGLHRRRGLRHRGPRGRGDGRRQRRRHARLRGRRRGRRQPHGHQRLHRADRLQRAQRDRYQQDARRPPGHRRAVQLHGDPGRRGLGPQARHPRGRLHAEHAGGGRRREGERRPVRDLGCRRHRAPCVHP